MTGFDAVAVVGTIGVGLLLVGFVLNLSGRLSQNTRSYLVLNLVGAGLSTYYALVLDAYPLVVLEGVWALGAGYKLAGALRSERRA